MRKMEHSEKKIIAAFSLSPDTVEAIEILRGRENRSSFVDRMMKGCLGVET